MIKIVGNKRYDTDTAKLLHTCGNYKAMCAEDGECAVYKTPKGAIFAIGTHWPNEYRGQETHWFFGAMDAARALTYYGQSGYIDGILGEYLQEAGVEDA